eukprot:TRINITY_DN9742_c3_g1_i1.p1 TRINITY_DN9742_c3_g1~~TRINITY_DN9742_c3_g1_i1.p1  ORF type:complete len:766 (+),score=131.59 TRINITY_DN9742_c3_g1_i1:46-2298(+)
MWGRAHVLLAVAAAARAAWLTDEFKGAVAAGEPTGVKVEYVSSQGSLGDAGQALGRADWYDGLDTAGQCGWYGNVGDISNNGWYPDPLATGDHRILLMLSQAVTRPRTIKVHNEGPKGTVKRVVLGTTAPDKTSNRGDKPANCFSGPPTEFACARKIEVYPDIATELKEPTQLEKYFEPKWSSDAHNPPPSDSFAPGMDYRGTVSVDSNGATCQSWLEDAPAKNPFQVGVGADGKLKLIGSQGNSILGTGVADHNHCRNPDGDPNGAWCFVGRCTTSTFNADGVLSSSCKKYCTLPEASCDAGEAGSARTVIDLHAQSIDIGEPVLWVEVTLANPGNTYLALDAVAIQGDVPDGACSSFLWRSPDCTACNVTSTAVPKEARNCEADFCSAAGDCVYGQCSGEMSCECYVGFYGEKCDQQCKLNKTKVAFNDDGIAQRPDLIDASVVCHGHGLCNTTDGRCHCDPGFAGAECEIACPGRITHADGSYDICSGRGYCQDGVNGDGVCKCDASFDGEACERVKCNGQSCINGQCVFIADPTKRCVPGDMSDRCFCACKGLDYLLDGEEGYWSGAHCEQCQKGWTTDLTLSQTRCSVPARSTATKIVVLDSNVGTPIDERLQEGKIGPIYHEICTEFDLLVQLEDVDGKAWSAEGASLKVWIGENKRHEAYTTEAGGCEKTATKSNPTQRCHRFYPLVAMQSDLYINYRFSCDKTLDNDVLPRFKVTYTYTGACEPSCVNGICSAASLTTQHAS